MVKLSPLCKKRKWFSEVKHLVDKEFKVITVEGEYIVFLCKDGMGRGRGRAFRRWHFSNLELSDIVLENK